ncbi:type IV pilus twitching motility protein PilT [Mobilitalea sibirica]|uniref:Type IV pilus twitching motility protein PilT n=2 Tax=Mobilitalea sibirica TaxID=1462919 RepID=A0A8J7H169_9FIRM|nr:type IV pilus twitching motility protein PilT [Mobilitalea sibirica]
MNLTIDDLLKDAQNRKASDLHLTVGVSPKCRVHGDLIDMGYQPLTPADTENLIMPIVPPRMKEILISKGEVDFSYSITGVGRYRVNVFKQRGSYALVIRIINTTIPRPEALGLPYSVVELTKKKRGLVLVTGPTGSGKSTTLASLLDIINTYYNNHIITLEDPIEYLHHHKKSLVNQREIGLDTTSFASALRVVLREDPDVILVGEMRDLETIEIAITAAETGHLVFSTLHTLGAVSTIDRIIDVFPPHQQQQIRVQLASVLEGVISQQLIPTLDGTSRVASFEVMLPTPAIRSLIREGKNHQIASFIQTSKKIGMQTMDDAIFELYLKGMIHKEQALSFAQDLTAMERKVNQ